MRRDRKNNWEGEQRIVEEGERVKRIRMGIRK
jgi:hypothetical protein